MPTTKIHNLIIIGSGPAGLTAGIYASRAALNPLLIEGHNPGGQLMGTSMVENWPGEKSILGAKLMMNMKQQAVDLGTTFISEKVTSVDLTQKPFTISTDTNSYKANSVIIATGAVHNRLNCEGEEQYWGKGVTTCAVCDGAFYPDKKVVIVGGGDTAMEDASFMTKYTQNITIVHILDKFTASAAMQKRVLHNPAITIIYNSTVTKIEGNGTHITHVTITDQKNNKSCILEADVLFLAIGQKPNTDMFKGQLELEKYGYISLKHGTATSQPGVFAAGDVADYKYKQAITSAAFGCMAALEAQRYLESEKDKQA